MDNQSSNAPSNAADWSVSSPSGIDQPLFGKSVAPVSPKAIGTKSGARAGSIAIGLKRSKKIAAHQAHKLMTGRALGYLDAKGSHVLNAKTAEKENTSPRASATRSTSTDLRAKDLRSKQPKATHPTHTKKLASAKSASAKSASAKSAGVKILKHDARALEFESAPLEPAARRSGYEIMLLTSRASAFLAGRDATNNLSWTQWEALRFFGGVYDALIPDPAMDGPARGAKTRRKDNPAAFARFMGLHVTNVTRATRALEKLGLMRMVQAPFENDVMRIGYVVEITKAGLDMIAHDPLRLIGDEIDKLFALGQQETYRLIQIEILTAVRRFGFSLPSGNKG
jgi:hypothetical protein